MTFYGKITPDQQNFQGVVKGFNVVSCLFAPDKRKATEKLVSSDKRKIQGKSAVVQLGFLTYDEATLQFQILSPLDISLNSSAPQGKGHHAAVMVSDILMTISPAIIRVLTATLSTMSVKQVRVLFSIWKKTDHCVLPQSAFENVQLPTVVDLCISTVCLKFNNTVVVLTDKCSFLHHDPVTQHCVFVVTLWRL